MIETEIKILEINKQEVLEKLKILGAKKTFQGVIEDIHYDFLNEKGLKLDIGNRSFRVRRKKNKYYYTIKKKIQGDLKSCYEHETEVTDLEGFKKVLEKYGMTKVRQKTKYRTSYEIGKTIFDIDEYKNIPVLLEIEGSQENIKKYIKILKLEKNIQKTFGSRGLFQYYGVEYDFI